MALGLDAVGGVEHTTPQVTTANEVTNTTVTNPTNTWDQVLKDLPSRASNTHSHFGSPFGAAFWADNDATNFSSCSQECQCHELQMHFTKESPKGYTYDHQNWVWFQLEPLQNGALTYQQTHLFTVQLVLTQVTGVPV